MRMRPAGEARAHGISAGAGIENSLRPATDNGRERAASNADVWWWSPAWAAICTLAKSGGPFTAEHLGLLGVPDPDDPCRVGSLFSAASRTHVIESDGASIGLDGRARRVWRGVRHDDVR